MADTLIEKVPPTIRQDPPKDPPKPRDRLRAIVIALSIVAVVLAVVAGAVFYFFVWRYEPVARKHIPGNVSVAVRLEAADIALFAPVREHFWPLLEARGGSKGKTRADRIQEATGVNLTTDLRELVIASVDGASYVAVAGGRIKRGRFVH